MEGIKFLALFVAMASGLVLFISGVALALAAPILAVIWLVNKLFF